MIPSDVLKQAQEEFKQELFREAVEAHKQKLREKKSFWDRIFPWRIIVVRKGTYDRRKSS